MICDKEFTTAKLNLSDQEEKNKKTVETTDSENDDAFIKKKLVDNNDDKKVYFLILVIFYGYDHVTPNTEIPNSQKTRRNTKILIVNNLPR